MFSTGRTTCLARVEPHV